MRVSTNIQFDAGLRAMTTQQAEIARLSQQISGERRVLNPGDDPIAAAREVTLEASRAAYEQMLSNQGDVADSLKVNETALTNAKATLDAFRSKMIQAGSGSLNDADRASLAKDMESLRSQMISLANQTDGNGNYLFSGYAAKTQPFVSNSANDVTYKGDTGVREVQVGPTRTIASNLTGDYVFASIPTGNGRAEASATDTNTGAGYLKNLSVTDNTAWKAAQAAGPYTVEFLSTTTGTTSDGIVVAQEVTDPLAWGKAAANAPYALAFGAGNSYTVTDAKGIETTGTYTAGTPLTVNGMEMTFGTDPVAGDTFTMGDIGGDYRILDGTGTPIAGATGSINSTTGGGVTFAGITLDIAGAVNAGDSFTFSAPGTADIFSTMQAAIDALRVPADNSYNSATVRNNVLREMTANLDGGIDRILEATSSIGTRGAELEALTSQDTVNRDNAATQITKEVGMGADDLVAAISELSQRTLSLQAAQKVYAQVSSMSLFNMI